MIMNESLFFPSPPEKKKLKLCLFIEIEEHFRQDFRMILQRIGGVILW